MYDVLITMKHMFFPEKENDLLQYTLQNPTVLSNKRVVAKFLKNKANCESCGEFCLRWSKFSVRILSCCQFHRIKACKECFEISIYEVWFIESICKAVKVSVHQP